VVDGHRRIVAIGYNGFPHGVADDALPWAREAASGSPLDTKYPYVVHAEANALLNASGGTPSLRGCALYVALFPCCECAKLAIQAGIREVVYLSDKYRDTAPMVAARRMLALAGVATRQFVPPCAELTLRLAE
jgi:dCMP deaminase